MVGKRGFEPYNHIGPALLYGYHGEVAGKYGIVGRERTRRCDPIKTVSPFLHGINKKFGTKAAENHHFLKIISKRILDGFVL
jgi:hypothetical protein